MAISATAVRCLAGIIDADSAVRRSLAALCEPCASRSPSVSSQCAKFGLISPADLLELVASPDPAHPNVVGYLRVHFGFSVHDEDSALSRAAMALLALPIDDARSSQPLLLEALKAVETALLELGLDPLPDVRLRPDWSKEPVFAIADGLLRMRRLAESIGDVA